MLLVLLLLQVELLLAALFVVRNVELLGFKSFLPEDYTQLIW